jgi:hypothetical protein
MQYNIMLNVEHQAMMQATTLFNTCWAVEVSFPAEPAVQQQTTAAL